MLKNLVDEWLFEGTVSLKFRVFLYLHICANERSGYV